MNKTIGVVVAMEKEFRLLPDILENKEEIRDAVFRAVVGIVGGHRVIYALSGIGKVAAAVCYHDVSCGADIAWGQVQGFPLYYPVSEDLLALFRSLPVPVREGVVCCGDRFLSSSEEQDFVRRTFPDAVAVDMESAALAQVAYIYRVPFIAVRIISDIAGEGRDNFAEYMDFWRKASPATFSILERVFDAM